MYDWSRFSKGGNRGNEDEPEAVPPADAADLPPAPGAAPTGPRAQMPEANVTLTSRPAPAPAAPPPMPTPAGAREPVETVVGRESSIQGTIRSEHSIRIQGTAQGEIESKHAVYVEEGASVNAKVTAAEITISGAVDGQIFSKGRVEIKPTGHVTGEINAASLIMQEGAYFDGQMKMKNRGEPEDGSAAERETPASPTGRRLPGAAGSRNSIPSE
ncbi:MAG TPA: polymer-forming cytoskeletal protein [Chloroflexota bacterium]|nr:polymer-forming cytoskeletal protein [Chloroflexota bacterium]